MRQTGRVINGSDLDALREGLLRFKSKREELDYIQRGFKDAERVAIQVKRQAQALFDIADDLESLAAEIDSLLALAGAVSGLMALASAAAPLLVIATPGAAGTLIRSDGVNLDWVAFSTYLDSILTGEADDNILQRKAGVWTNQTMAQLTAALSASGLLTLIKTVDGSGSGLDADTLDGIGSADLAPLVSPTFTGTPAAPTAAHNTNSTQLATTAYLDRHIQSDSQSVADDAVGTFAVTLGAGQRAVLFCASNTGASVSIFGLDTTGTYQISTMVLGTLVINGGLATPPAPAAGTDGNTNWYFGTDGVVYVSNRLGSTLTFYVTMMTIGV